MNKNVLVFDGNPIYHSNSGFKLSKEEMMVINGMEMVDCTDELSLVSKSKDILKNEGLKNVKNFFNEQAQHYIDNILEIKIGARLTDSWVTIQRKGGSHHPHWHTNALLSIVYYPQIKDGNIYFFTPKSKIEKETNLGFEIINENIFNSPNTELTLNQNDIVIFPGWLQHGVRKNKSEGYRISIAANYWIKGKLGAEDAINRLSLWV